MERGKLRPTLIGFGLAAAAFGAADGWLIGEDAAGAVAGALVGGLIGVGLALLAWRPQPQDSEVLAPGGHGTNYMLIWAVLFVLTILEVGVAFVALSKLAVVAMLLALAVWKALLVALYYMHLKYEPRRMWLLAASPLPLAVILVVTVLYEGW